MKINWTYIAFFLIIAPTLLYFCCANQGLWWDETVYLGLGRNILEGQGYFINLHQDSFRPPLFAYMTAGIWSIFGVSESLVRALPPLFAILAAFSALFLARKLYWTGVGTWAILLLGTSPLFLFYSERFLTESLFVLLTTLSLLFFYMGTRPKARAWHLPLAGALAGLAFLTRYAGGLLILVYILYPLALLVKERSLKKSLFRNKSYWLGLALFALLLLPWMGLSQAYYGSPFGALSPQGESVSGEWYGGPWWFYFQNWTEIFGLAGLFAVPGVAAMVYRRRDSDILLLLTLAVTLGFFMLIVRKELRYLIHFFSFYYLAAALGIDELAGWVKRRGIQYLVPAAAALLIGLNLFAGIQMVQGGIYSASALREAGLWLAGQDGAAIMSNNVPPLHYYTGRLVHYFPEDQAHLAPNITAHGISHIVLEYWEPTYPGYVWDARDGERAPSGIFEGFTLERVFEEYGRATVWVYRV
ncbi:MAG: ArnT family glycosyltransferase [Candidatus Aenigmatarchaeota archaeon]